MVSRDAERKSCVSLNGHIHGHGRPARQIARFCAVGALTAVLYLGATAVLRDWAIPMQTAAAVAFVIVVSVNYILHYFWTFKSTGPHATTVPRFLATVFGGMLINALVLAMAQHWQTLPETIRFAVGMAFIVVWNFFVSRKWVFATLRSKVDDA